jgi:hypothetical protein
MPAAGLPAGLPPGETKKPGRLDKTTPVQQRTLKVRAASIRFDPIVGISQSPSHRGISILTRYSFCAIDFACRNSSR